MTNYGTVRCCECDQDLTDKAQYYDNGKVYCCECNWRVNQDEEVPQKHEAKK